MTSADPILDASQRPVDRIVIEDLRVQAFIGVFDFERAKRQTVRFDVEIETVPGYAQVVRETGDYVSYAETVEYVLERAASREHVELVETWAEDVAAVALRSPLAARAHVRVLKLDIFGEAHGVGVRITRDAEARQGKSQ